MIQLQNFVSLTTTGTSGAATLSNGVLNVPNYDTSGGGAWVDYSSTSTIVGWSSFTTKQIRYRIIGKQMFVQVFLEGTSNSTNTTFTLPNQQKNINFLQINLSADNGVQKINSFFYTVLNSSTVTCYQSSLSTWTAIGTKAVYGQFFFEID